MSWDELFHLSADNFMARAGHLYPQARSIFEFLADRGKLSCWYRALIETCGEDPTGGKAFEVCFEESLATVERQWQQWVNSGVAVSR